MDQEILRTLSKNLEQSIALVYRKFAQIFNKEKIDGNLLNYLKSIAIPTYPIRNKQITNLYKCAECEANNSANFCTECYENSKDKHKDHHVMFYTNRIGVTCDCGDPLLWLLLESQRTASDR